MIRSRGKVKTQNVLVMGKLEGKRPLGIPRRR
jgi:hypothetical protein